jgi:hypothetical protein
MALEGEQCEHDEVAPSARLQQVRCLLLHGCTGNPAATATLPAVTLLAAVATARIGRFYCRTMNAMLRQSWLQLIHQRAVSEQRDSRDLSCG